MLVKGDRILAEWYKAAPLGTYSLSGMQSKVAAQFLSVTGTIRHIRGDDPVNPKEIRVWIDPDPETYEFELTRPYGCTCEGAHVELHVEWIKGRV